LTPSRFKLQKTHLLSESLLGSTAAGAVAAAAQEGQAGCVDIAEAVLGKPGELHN